MKRYDPKTIEPQWQQTWAETGLYQATEDPTRPKLYATPMLPYPSGAGLHVGHVRNYSIADAVSRYHRQKGFNVMSNIGWDSFGLPAENYAIKTGTPPAVSTAKNIKNFKNQLLRLGIGYDWSRELNTSDPDYYRWTQWVFTQLFSRGLAYQKESLQWWCPECKTVLANEQVEGGFCWRHDTTAVVKRFTKQWFFKITEYADELLDSIDDLDWPENIKTMQRNWIGRSVGAFAQFPVEGHHGVTVDVFTTRIDTIHGATFMVLAPENPLATQLATPAQRSEVEAYVAAATKRSEVDRQDAGREKTGVFTGAHAINPATGSELPIWVADYVLGSYGTGAIMAVPAHDDRDGEFARKFDLAITPVVDTAGEDVTGEGTMINSGPYDGLDSATARERMLADYSKAGWAREQVQYKMRDWLISRQRYWGAPIPIIHCPEHGAVAVPEDQLPVVLPDITEFAPNGTAISVLAGESDWVNTACPTCGAPAQRETDTMDGYACSSWYMYRYTDARNDQQAWDPAKANYWFPVDFYFGGDHAVSHLLYFRFWNKFFADLGLISVREPVKRLVYNGYINAADGSKMSKSKGNVIDPLDVIDSGYGADALRLYELFIAPYDQDVAWNTNGIDGASRFLHRFWTLVQEAAEATENDPDRNGSAETRLQVAVHKTIKKVTTDLEQLSFNTAIAALMEFVNEAYKLKLELPIARNARVWQQVGATITSLLAPFVPHITEELWHDLGQSGSVHVAGWPTWDEALMVEDTWTIVVQINGKVRATLVVAADSSEADITAQALADPAIVRYLAGQSPVKTIYVPGKIVNFVVR